MIPRCVDLVTARALITDPDSSVARLMKSTLGSPSKTTSQAAINFDAHYQTMLMEEARSFLLPYIRCVLFPAGHWGPDWGRRLCVHG